MEALEKAATENISSSDMRPLPSLVAQTLQGFSIDAWEHDIGSETVDSYKHQGDEEPHAQVLNAPDVDDGLDELDILKFIDCLSHYIRVLQRFHPFLQ